MTYNDFINLVNKCPLCNNEMKLSKFETEKFNIRGINLTCEQNHFHHESYVCCMSGENIDKIPYITIHFNSYFICWLDNIKELHLRDPFTNLIIRKVFENKESLNWLQLPTKNIITKAQALMMLK